jgi:predicted transcriptional regulator
MGLFDNVLGKGKKKATHVSITSIGKKKVEESSGGLRFSILSHLEDSGSSSYNELAEATGKDIHKIKATCKQMLHDGEIRETIDED